MNIKLADHETQTLKLLELSRLTSTISNWKTSLDELFTTAKSFLIFDNLVIYQTDFGSNRLDALYARATGRGKTAEADVSWGEALSNRVILEQKLIVEIPEEKGQSDRLKLPFLLGIPINFASFMTGVIVFIRFGGPEYSTSEIEIGNYLANLTTSIIRQKFLSDFGKELEQEKKIARLQADFISTISHELRSPLGFIKGYTTTLLRDDTKWDHQTQIDFLQIIERESNNLTELIDNLLDSSRLQSGQMKFTFQVVRIDSIIKDEINRALIANPGQKILMTCENNIPTIFGDTHRLAQVFDNLLSNTRKYAPQSQVNIAITHETEFILIKFEDDGPGIPEQYLSRIFTRFFRVPDQTLKAHGSGLGLSICRQIIESHGGSITVSSPKNGVIFTIRLPIGNSKPVTNLENLL
jgi:signal transduction histidine kinase